MKPKDFLNYTTRSEILHLDHLGSFAKPQFGKREDIKERRLRLLRNYKASMGKRMVWDLIDRATIATYTDRLIEETNQVE